MIVGTSINVFSFLVQLNNRQEPKSFNLLNVKKRVAFPASSGRKVRSYFFSNDIHSNQPLIQYKFPLSEHTEAG